MIFGLIGESKISILIISILFSLAYIAERKEKLRAYAITNSRLRVIFSILVTVGIQSLLVSLLFAFGVGINIFLQHFWPTLGSVLSPQGLSSFFLELWTSL